MSHQVPTLSHAVTDTRQFAAIKGKWYTDDDITNLILEKYKAFRQSLKEEKREFFKKNVKNAKACCEELYAFLFNVKKIKCNSIHLKHNSISSFEAIVVLTEIDYLSASFDIAYGISLEVMNHYNNNGFEITFNFMPYARKINYETLMADGYHLTYKTIKK